MRGLYSESKKNVPKRIVSLSQEENIDSDENQPLSHFSRLKKIYYEWGYIYRLPLVYSLLWAALLGGVFTQQYYYGLKDEVNDQHEELNVYKALIESHLLRYDFDAINSMAELLLYLEYVKKISVTDINGYSVVDIHVDNFSSENSRYYDYTLNEVSTDGSDFIGYMSVVTRSEPVWSLVGRLLLVLVSVFFLVFFVSALLLVRYASTHVARPLQLLSDAIGQTLRSGSPVKTGLDDSTHIGRYAAEFNSMQERLTYVQLEVINQVKALEKQTIINQQHVSILDAVMHNFNNTIRYFDNAGNVTDYGESSLKVDFLLIPDMFFKSAQNAIAYLNNRHESQLSEIRDVGSGGMSISKGLYQVECKSHSNSIYLLTAFALPDYGFAYTLSDVTKSKNIERDLAQAQKMEALGVLTSGISHDFNNMLGVVIGNIELAMMVAKDREAIMTPLNTARKAGMTGAAVVQSMLAYSRSREYDVEVINVSSHVQELLPLLKGSLPPEIEMLETLDCEGWCRVNIGLFESAILNLVANARDAIEGEGEIEIAVHKANDAMLARAKITSSEYIAITVNDTGPGVQPDVVQRIYDPFFTTKREGTGLGLSLIYGFTEQVGGKLHYESHFPRGSSFTIFLPIVSGATPIANGLCSKKTESSKSLILLVDDELALLEVFTSALELHSYQVVSCSSYKEAKQLLVEDSNTEQFDLVISDVKLKDGDGISLLAFKRDSLATILISGNTVEELPRGGNVVEVLTKPFTINFLISSVEKQVRRSAVTFS